MRKVTLGVAVSGGAATFGLSDLNSVMPSGSTYEIRIQKLSFYGTATDSLLSVSDVTSDKVELRDVGTAGQQKGQVHLTPALVLRQAWNGQAATTVLYNIVATDPAITSITVQATVEVRFL